MDKLDVALLNQQGGKKPTTISKERLMLLRIAQVVKRNDGIMTDVTALAYGMDVIKSILVEGGVLSGKS